jgi:hypothetical protein
MGSCCCPEGCAVSAPEKRLEEAKAALTGRERAVLILRPWIAGGEPDERLRKHMLAVQKPEVDRIVKAIDDYNQNSFQALSYVLEWLWHTETQLAWLECLDGFLRREAAGRAPRNLPPLPSPGRTFHRDLPMLYGRRVGEDEPLPADWQEARDQLVREVSEAIKLRWAEYVSWHRVEEELEAEMGEEMLHVEARAAAEAIGEKVTELREALERLAGPVELGLPTPERLDQAREYVDWAALKPPAPPPGQNNGRPGMPAAELAELEALEARLAEGLRAKRN